MTSLRRDQAIRVARKRARAASGRIGSARSDSPAKGLSGGAVEQLTVRRAKKGDFLVKAIKTGSFRRSGNREPEIFKVQVSNELDERVMELERQVELLRHGGYIQTISSQPVARPRQLNLPTSFVQDARGMITGSVPVRSSIHATLASAMYRQPAPYKLDGPLDRNRMTVKATDPATLSKERGRTILTRFGLDPDTEEE